MPRSRNIKPGFFANEDLAELSFETRLLFIGLWTLADREGRLYYRPKRIKAHVFPYDSADVEAGVAALCKRDFATVYEVGGKLVLQIHKWTKHQNPHPREAASEIPAMNNDVSRHGLGNDEARPGTGPAGLIPDSGFLIPDVLIPDTKPKAREKPRAVVLAFPEWLDMDAWNDWDAFRRTRKGWTDKARSLSLRTLDKLYKLGHDPRAVIEQSIERGWTGLFEIKFEGGSRGNSAVERVQRNNRNW